MEKLKYKIEQISRKEIKDTKFLKQSIFDGNIFIFKKSPLCAELINLTNMKKMFAVRRHMNMSLSF